MSRKFKMWFFLSLLMPVCCFFDDAGGGGAGGAGAGGAEGGAGGAGAGGAEGGAGGAGAGVKTYTETQVKDMMKQAEERATRRAGQENSAKRKELEALFSTEDWEKLPEESPLKGTIKKMRDGLLSEKEQAELQRQASANALKAAQEGQAVAEKQFNDFVINRALKDAAMPKAAGKDPSATADLIANLLTGKAKRDPASNTVLVEMEVEENGVKMKKSVTPDEAVAQLEKTPDKYGTLFKSTAKSGFGSGNDPKSGSGEQNFKDMPWEEFKKLAEEHPEKVGLARK